MKSTVEIVVDELEALAAHYPRGSRAPEEQRRWLQDYADDLKAFEPEAIRKGCVKWRQSAAGRFPTPGQLIATVKDFSAVGKPDKMEAWHPLSDGEYEALSLADKMRHHRICANEAELKAGPMWSNGRPKTREDMSPEWHAWKSRAENHHDEAKRLWSLVRKAEGKAA